MWKTASSAQPQLRISPAKYRSDVSSEGRDLLDEIWRYHRDNGFGFDAWPTTQSLHIRHGKGAVAELITQLPPGSIYMPTSGPGRYALSFLGLLLSSAGPDFERVLVHYLEFVVGRAMEDPNLTKIDGAEATQAVNLGPSRRALVGRLVNISGVWSREFAGGENWSCGVPEDLDDLVSTTNLSGYLWRRALDNAAMFAKSHAREAGTTRGHPSQLWFVRSKSLRESLERDFQELQVAVKHAAPKSAVVLSGEILEGILLDELRCRSRPARAAYRKLRGSAPPPLVRWALGDLIDVASDLGLLPGGTVQLSNALREFRNLIHPGRSVRLRHEVSAEEARAAHAALEVCRKHFSQRATARRKSSSA